MASIKQLKSKGKAIMFDPLRREYIYEYAYRKKQFADLPPAKIVRPLRAIRKVYEQALAAWERSVVKDGSVVYPYGEEVTYRSALRFAKAGQGQLVSFCAS